MMAKDLKPGDCFVVVGHIDRDSKYRVCLESGDYGVKFGFPRSRFWCYMGDLCKVRIISDEGRRAGDKGVTS